MEAGSAVNRLPTVSTEDPFSVTVTLEQGHRVYAIYLETENFFQIPLVSNSQVPNW